MKDKEIKMAKTGDLPSAKSQQKFPSWWPLNPYPEDVFPETPELFVHTVPNPKLRTAIAGALGRYFRRVASQSIWNCLVEKLDLAIYDAFATRLGPDEWELADEEFRNDFFK